MNYFFDTEFYTNDKVLEPISIGIVDENDKSFYAVFNSSEFDFDSAWNDEWLKDNVLIPIYIEHEDDENFTYENVKYVFDTYGQTKEEIRDGIIEYVSDPNPEFFAYYSSHDFVLFCFIFGGMLELPENYPMYAIDLKQMMYHLDLSTKWKEEVCPDPEGIHNALIDAEWNKELYECILNEV